MWISRKKLNELEHRIEALERSRKVDADDQRIFVRYEPSDGGYGSQWSAKTISVKEAVKLLADHLNVKFEKTRAVPEVATIVPLSKSKK